MALCAMRKVSLDTIGKREESPPLYKRDETGPNDTLTLKSPLNSASFTPVHSSFALKMQQYTLITIVMGITAVFLTASTTGSVISCPPTNLQEANSNLRSLCNAIEQAISENMMLQDQPAGMRLDEKKRQDVDHVFLRFGRRFGL